MEVTAVNENLIINESFIHRVVPKFEFRYTVDSRSLEVEGTL